MLQPPSRPVRLAELAEDEILIRWCAILPDGHREPAGWRFPCPCCGTPRVLSVQAKPGKRRPDWNSHCACARDDVHAKLAALGLAAARRTRRTPSTDALTAIITDKTLPPNALRVALLFELGLTAAEIRAQLAMPKQTWSDAVRKLGQHRRSA